jgi:ribonuclease HI
MRKIAGAFKTTPIHALEAELGLPPSDIRLDKMQRSYATRLFTLPDNHPILELCPDSFPKTLDDDEENLTPRGFTDWYEQNPRKPKYHSRLVRLLSTINKTVQPQSIIEEINVTASPPWDNTTTPIDIQIAETTKDIAATLHTEKHYSTHADARQICFYTDGSLIEGKAGAGVYASRAAETIHESKYYLGTETEVFDAELYGMMKATHTATQLTTDGDISDVWIFCDNQSAVRRMRDKRPLPGQEYILKTHSYCEILNNRNIKIHIHWVPGHVSVKGNERADVLAKEGTEGRRLPRDSSTSITYLRRKNKEAQLQEWTNRWPASKHGRQYQGRPAMNIHPLLRNHPSRRLVSTVIQMRTGHGYNRNYLARIPSSTIDSPTCPCGYRKQTPEHLLLHCKHYRTERKTLTQKMKPLPPLWRTAMHTTRGLAATLKFLEDTGVGTRTWILGPRDVETGGFGWSHMRDDEERGGRGEGEARSGRLEDEVAEVVGVG